MTDAPPPRGASRVALIAALGVIGTAWALGTPPGSAPDEPAHTIYAAAVARGQVVAPVTPIPDNDAGLIGETTTVRVDTAYHGLHVLPLCYAFQPDVPAGCSPPVPPSTSVGDVTTNAGTYPPAYYAVVGLPSLALAPVASLYAARLLSAWVAAALLATALVSVWRTTGGPLRLLGPALAITPMTVYLAATVNPNGVEVAAAVLAWAAAIEWAQADAERGAVVRFSIGVAALALSRPLGPGWAVGLLVAAAVLVPREKWRAIRSDRRVLAALLGAVAAIGVTVGWVLWRDTLGTFTGVPAGDLTLGERLRTSLGMLPARIRQMVGFLGWADVFLPGWVVTTWIAAVGLLAAAGLWLGRWRDRLVIVGVVVATLAAPVAGDVLSANDVGFAFQGRYVLPAAVGIPIVSAAVLGRRVAASTVWVAVGLAFVAVAQTAVFVVTLGRYENGAAIQALRSIVGVAAWEPPVPDLLLVALLGGAWAVLVVGAVRPGAGQPWLSADASAGSSSRSARMSAISSARVRMRSSRRDSS